jgi:hypothetical protein
VKDILAGIQHLIKEGIADPERIAVMGWRMAGISPTASSRSRTRR